MNDLAAAVRYSLRIGVIIAFRGQRTDTSDSGEVCRDSTVAQRKDPSALGRGGGTGTRTRGNRAGGRGDGVVEGDDQRGPAGIGRRSGRRRCRGTVARAGGSRSQGPDRARRRLGGGVGKARRPGDARRPMRWTCSSAAPLARELQEAGQRVSERSVNRLLHALDARGETASESGRAVQPHQPPGAGFSSGASQWCQWTRILVAFVLNGRQFARDRRTSRLTLWDSRAQERIENGHKGP